MIWFIISAVAAASAGIIIVRAYRPAPADLPSALDRLYGGSDVASSDLSFVDRKDRLPVAAGQLIAKQPSLLAKFTVPHQDLKLLQKPVSWYLGRKVLTALLAGLAVLIVAQVFAIAGIAIPTFVPLVAAPALAGLIFFRVDAEIRKEASEERQEFTYGVAAYIELVALQRKLGASPADALKNAAREGDSKAFLRIRETITNAAMTHTPAWDAIKQLGADTKVSALDDVANIVKMSSETGSGVYDTLRARSASLRNAIQANDVDEAKADTGRMTFTSILFLIAFVGMLLAPQVMRLPT